jgi:hypothetical protein
MRTALRNPLVSLIALTGLTFFTFGDIQTYFFTDVDTFSLIDDGRSRTLSDVVAHFGSELMSGRMVNAVFYRPLTSITFGAEYALFGLNPRGYHVVSLTILSLTAFLLLHVAQAIWTSTRGTLIGSLAAVLFILHPLQLDAVPAIARLGDLLFTLFTLLALACVIDVMCVSGGRLRRTVAGSLSVVFACLALLAKEPGILAPFVLGLSVFVFSRELVLAGRIRRTLLFMAPHAGAVSALVFWRLHVLHGIGGGVDARGQFVHFGLSGLAVKMTILGHIVAPFFSALTDSFDRYGAAFFVEHKALIYPVFLGVILVLAARVFRSGLRVSLTPYDRREEPALTDERAAWIFGGLIALHFMLLTFTGFSSRYLYFSLTGFAFLLALAIVKTGECLARHQPAYGRLVPLVLVLAVVYWHSPAWSKDRLERWQMSSEVAREILTDLEAIVRANDKARIFILNLPYGIRFGESTFVSELPTNQLLLDHSLFDYLDLRGLGPASRPEVIVLSYLLLTGPPEDLRIRSEFLSPTTLRVSVDQGGVPGEYPWQEIAGRRRFKDFFQAEGGSRAFERQPPGGWSHVMIIRLLPPALQESPRRVYAYNGRGLQEVTPVAPSPPDASDRSTPQSIPAFGHADEPRSPAGVARPAAAR